MSLGTGENKELASECLNISASISAILIDFSRSLWVLSRCSAFRHLPCVFNYKSSGRVLYIETAGHSY